MRNNKKKVGNFWLIFRDIIFHPSAIVMHFSTALDLSFRNNLKVVKFSWIVVRVIIFLLQYCLIAVRLHFVAMFFYLFFNSQFSCVGFYENFFGYLWFFLIASFHSMFMFGTSFFLTLLSWVYGLWGYISAETPSKSIDHQSSQKYIQHTNALH